MHIIVVKTPITINYYNEMKNGQNNYYKKGKKKMKMISKRKTIQF